MAILCHSTCFRRSELLIKRQNKRPLREFSISVCQIPLQVSSLKFQEFYCNQNLLLPEGTIQTQD